MTYYIVVYRPHGAAKLETKHYGPFTDVHAASDCLESLPAIGINRSEGEAGCKYITDLRHCGS